MAFTNVGPHPSHTVSQMLAAIKANVKVIRDMAAGTGLVQGWDLTLVFPSSLYNTGELYDRATDDPLLTEIELDHFRSLSSGGNVLLNRTIFYHFPDADILDFSYNSDDLVISTSWSNS